MILVMYLKKSNPFVKSYHTRSLLFSGFHTKSVKVAYKKEKGLAVALKTQAEVLRLSLEESAESELNSSGGGV